MQPIKVVAIPTEIAETVRMTMKAPVYGFPAHVEMGKDDAPCRHCLKLIAGLKERRILFTYDRFSGVEELPQPGPVYIHADECARYGEDSGIPAELRGSPRTVEAYARGRRFVAAEYVENGKFEEAIQELFSRAEVEYLQVQSTTAGCFTFRIERGLDS
jgi:hypothetical protein